MIQYKLNEFSLQEKWIVEGILSVVSPDINMFTWEEISQKLMGSPDIKIDDLKHIFVGGDYGQDDEIIHWFWDVLEEFTPEGKRIFSENSKKFLERSMFLRFTWGRSQLPLFSELTRNGTTFTINKMYQEPEDNYLPASHTCYFTLDLPKYSSQDILKEKLLFAIQHCKAIDTDYEVTE